MLYVFFIPMPAYLFAFLWIAFSVYGMKSRLGNIGHEAHLGGAIGGFVSHIDLDRQVNENTDNSFTG